MRLAWLVGAMTLTLASGSWGACVPNNGYPWPTGGCLDADDLNRAIASRGVNVSDFGADVTGNKDATSALQNCLTQVGVVPGGTCTIDSGARLLIGGNISIPNGTGLKCTDNTFLDQEDSFSYFNNSSAIMLSGTISLSGDSGWISNCLIYRAGMTFPSTSSAGFAGLAISDAGHHNLTVTDSVIIGFQQCIYITGKRPYIKRVYMDCQGSGSSGTWGAAFELDNSNTDGGMIGDLKIQPLATGNGDCVASRRGNVGMGLNGINESSGLIVVENFNTNFAVGVSEWIADGTLWSDSMGTDCSWTGTKGFQINTSLQAHRLDVNGTVQGVVFGTGSVGGQSHISEIFLTKVSGNCVVMQFGQVHIDGLYNNAGSNNCGGYAVYYPPTMGTAVLDIDYASLFGLHGGVAPYIANGSSTEIYIPVNLHIKNLRTDLAAGVNPFGPNIGFAAGSEPELQLTRMGASVSCAGMGSGTCSLVPDSHVTVGAVQLNPGTGAATGGAITLTFNAPAAYNWDCTASTANAGGVIAMSPGYPVIQTINPTQVAITWAQASALTNGQVYGIIYHCLPL